MSLAALRDELDGIDERLVALLGERLRLVAEVRRLKRASGAAPFDRERERQVLRRAEEQAAAHGVPPAAARALLRAVLEASHDAQEEPPSALKRFLVVGGAGRMGRRLSAALAARGHAVEALEKGEPLDPARVAAADVVMIAVPMTEAERVTAAVAPLVRADALLCDVNSLKAGVCRAMAACPAEAVGMHPMFGPTVGSLRRQKIVVCPVKSGPNAAWLMAELGKMGAEIVAADPEAHDRTMAVVQVLAHFGIMAMGGALARSGRPLAETLPFMSPIYRLELAMVGRLFSQSAELYREIVMSNPHGGELLAGFVAQAAELERVIRERDEAAFARGFADTAAYFAEFSREAMALSDLIIDTLMSRA